MSSFEQRRYLLMTHDPVHIGTGGYRLGRVDNSIVREPGSGVPKIPGTSLHGAARSYAARLYEEPAAAGQSQDGVVNPAQDPICYTFGYIQKAPAGPATAESTIAYSGVVNVGDALLVLFPVHSLVGPVWVSTTRRLSEAGFTIANEPDTWPSDQVLTTLPRQDPLNLGWLMLEVAGNVTVTAPNTWQVAQWTTVANRIVIVQESLFSAVVNSNLEVRTSVSINPLTGAAEDGALFTYEALPRSAFLTCEVVLDDYRAEEVFLNGGITQTIQQNPLPGAPWRGPLDVLESGFNLMGWLGVGGMGTRGFGRVAPIGQPLPVPFA